MSSTASDSHHRYVVYVPRSKDSEPCPIYVPENADVDTLEEAICKERVFEDDLQGQYPIPFKCGNLKILPRQSRYESALEWLRQHTGDGEDDKRMVPAIYLHDYFPGGPTPEDEEMIDIVVVTKSILAGLDYIALSQSGASIPFREEVTFIIRRIGKRLNWYSVNMLNDYSAEASLPQFIRDVVQRPRRVADIDSGVVQGLQSMLKASMPEDRYAEIVPYLLSNKSDAASYTQWHLEVNHYIQVLVWANCWQWHLGSHGTRDGGPFKEEQLHFTVLMHFREYWKTQVEGEQHSLRKQFPFYFIAKEVNNCKNDRWRKYQPQHDTAFFKNDFPRFLAKIDSIGKPDGKEQLLVQMACTLRLALAFRQRINGCNDENFFLMGAFFTTDQHIYRYFFYSNKGKICFHERYFDMIHVSELMKFLHEFYNYVLYVNEADTLGDKRPYIMTLYHAVRKGVRTSLHTKTTEQETSSSGSSTDQDDTDRSTGQGSSEPRRAAMIVALQKSDFKIYEYPKFFEPITELPAYIVEATSPNGDRVVAKLVRKDSAELSLLQELSRQISMHNHVIQLLDTVSSSFGPMAILPRATTLCEFITFRLSEERHGVKFVQLSRDLIEGVAFLHRQKIAHLDIKPSNLVVNFKRLYIIDFDIAVRCKDVDEMVKISRGTRGWSAPEIGFDDDEAPDACSPIRADLWSCGKVLKFITEKTRQNDSDIIRLTHLLMDTDPRQRPLLHEVVDERPDFWASGRLLQAVNRQGCCDKAGTLKRARVDTAPVGKEMLSSKVRRTSISTTPPLPPPERDHD